MRNSQQLRALLVAEGLTRNIIDESKLILKDKGFNDPINTAFYKFLGDEGYTGQLSERYQTWFEDGFPGFVTTPITTEATITSVDADGWQAVSSDTSVFDSPYDPYTTPSHVVVQRPGFNASGGAITVTDNLPIMTRVRLPDPNELTLTANNVAMSDFVYSGDVITGVTNNSTRTYKKPLAVWLDGDLPTVYDSTYTAKLIVAHQYARSGQPVRAVKFIASDGSNPDVTSTVSSMTKTDYTASGLSAPHFEAALDLSSLNDDALITIDAVIYPWVGTSTQASTDYVAYPSINFCEMKVVNLSTEGPVYAYVDGVGGGTPAVNETPATAQANPYATILAAMQAVSAYNNTNFSRNNATGGIIRLEDGTYAHEDLSAVVVGDAGVVLEGVNSTGAIWQGPGSSNVDDLPDKIVIKDLTLQSTIANVFWLMNGANSTNDRWITYDNVVWDKNGFTNTTAFIMDESGFVTFINNSGDDMLQAVALGGDSKMAKSIGCSGPFIETGTYNAVGCHALNALMRDRSSATHREAGFGQFVGFNFLGDGTQIQIVIAGSITASDIGFALVGNVVEQRGGTLSGLINLGGETGECVNVIDQMNTTVGARTFHAYTDGSSTFKHTQIRDSVHFLRNTKGDVFDSAANIENWSTIYQVGSRGIVAIEGDSNGASDYGVGIWLGEIEPFDSANGTAGTPVVVDWVDDGSSIAANGDGTGDGDYRPGGSTALPTIPAGLTTYPFDHNGTAVPTDGTAKVGALQP